MTEEKKKKSPYDDYMQMATDIYNEQKQQNLKQAENQSALAHAQYQEVNRNINEINKAKGLTDTGYQGDTSVDAYNVYRNSVNSAYSNANASNNQLYSYYLNQMSQLEQAKQNQEFQQDQFNYQKEQDAIANQFAQDQFAYQKDKDEYQKNWNEKTYNDTIERQKREDVIQTLTYLSDSSFYGDDRLLTEEGKTKLLNYAKSVYGDNIPADILEIINSGVGFNQPVKEKAKEYTSDEVMAYLVSTVGRNDNYFKADGTLTEEGINAYKNAAAQYYGGDYNKVPIEIKNLIEQGGFSRDISEQTKTVLGILQEAIPKSQFDDNGVIEDDSAEYLWDLVESEYGEGVEIEDLPTKVQTQLNKIQGFDDWLFEYNMQKTPLGDYINNTETKAEFNKLNESEKNKIREYYLPQIVKKYVDLGYVNGLRTFMGANHYHQFLGDTYTKKAKELIEKELEKKKEKDNNNTWLKDIGVGSGSNTSKENEEWLKSLGL